MLAVHAGMGPGELDFSARSRGSRGKRKRRGQTVASRDEYGTEQAKLTISPREHLLLQ
jgi:hypothetical protein